MMKNIILIFILFVHCLFLYSIENKQIFDFQNDFAGIWVQKSNLDISGIEVNMSWGTAKISNMTDIVIDLFSNSFSKDDDKIIYILNENYVVNDLIKIKAGNYLVGLIDNYLLVNGENPKVSYYIFEIIEQNKKMKFKSVSDLTQNELKKLSSLIDFDISERLTYIDFISNIILYSMYGPDLISDDK